MRSNTVTRMRLGLFAGAFALAGFAPSLVPAQDAAPATGDAQQATAQDAEQAQARERRRRQGGGGQGGVRTEDVVKELDLTDEQKTKVDAILAETRAAQQEARGLQGEERRQKMQEVQRSQREKLNAVLNAEQQQKFQQAMAKAQATQTTQRLRGAVAQLGLSQEQQTKVDAILADAEKKVQEASAQPQDAGAGGRGRGGPYRAVMQETRQKINEVLTADQKTKFAELAPEGGRGQGQGGRRRNNQQQ